MNSLRVKLILEAIDQLTAPVRRMATSFSAHIKQMAADTRKLGKEIQEIGKGISGAGSWISTRLSAAAALYGRQAINVQKQTEGLQSRLIAALSDQKLAEDQYKRLRLESDRLGTSFIQTGNSYVGFAASITRAGFSVEQTNKMFSDFAETTVSLKLDNDRIGFAFRALEQMASKPAIQMEELKTQLADHIPGAVQIAARAMNMNTNKFIREVERGRIKSKVFIPKYIEQLKKELGSGFAEAAKGILAEENRTLNSLLDSQGAAADAGLADVWRRILVEVRKLSSAFVELPEGMQSTIVKVGLVMAVLGPLIFIIGQITIGIGGLVIGFGMIAPALGPVLAILATLIGVLKAVTLGLLATPFGWFLLGAAAFAGAVYLIKENWGSIKDFFAGVWDGIKEVFQSGVDWVMEKLKPILDIMATIKEGFGSSFSVTSAPVPVAGPPVMTGTPDAARNLDAGGTLKIEIDSTGAARLVDLRPNDSRMEYQTDTGLLMGTP